MILGALFIVLMLMLFCKMVGLFFRLTFGVGKVLLTILFWPVVLVILILGIFRFLIPLLVIGGIIWLIVKYSGRRA